ncbi:MAG: hypothetical protein ACOY4K_13580 [Pseudomonadota bacterium]
MKRRILTRAVLACAMAAASAASAQDAAAPADAAPAAAPATADTAPAAPAPAAPAPGMVRVTNGAIVTIELVDTVTSKTAVKGQKFAIKLAAPLVVDGQTLLPAGVGGVGEVITVGKPGIGGKPGELILAARFLTYKGQTIPLRGFRFGAAGKDTSAASLAVGMVVPVGIFITGGQVVAPAGSQGTAKIAVDIDLAPVSGAADVQPPAPTAPASTETPR